MSKYQESRKTYSKMTSSSQGTM